MRLLCGWMLCAIVTLFPLALFRAGAKDMGALLWVCLAAVGGARIACDINDKVFQILNKQKWRKK